MWHVASSLAVLRLVGASYAGGLQGAAELPPGLPACFFARIAWQARSWPDDTAATAVSYAAWGAGPAEAAAGGASWKLAGLL